MKITIFIGGLYGGGAERVACNLANYLSRKCHDVTLLTMSENSKRYYVEPSIKITPLLFIDERSNFIIDNAKRWIRLKRYINTYKDNNFVVMLPVTTILLLLLRRKIPLSIIAAERNDPSKYSKIKQILLKYLSSRADGYVFQTDSIRQWYGKRVNNAYIIPNAINEQFICPKYHGPKYPMIVGAGRLTKQKNFPVLIEAFSRVSSSFPNYSLYIYGEGPDKEKLLELSRKLGVSDSVKLPGRVDDLPDKLKCASLFVLSSNYEGMPNVLIESMALGVPCISTDCDGGGPSFLIENYKNGIIVPKNDVEALSESMKCLLSNSELSESLGKNARNIIEKLSPTKIYDLWEKTLLEVVNRE